MKPTTFSQTSLKPDNDGNASKRQRTTLNSKDPKPTNFPLHSPSSKPTTSADSESSNATQKRLDQRLRMIQYGKNTIGYDEYLRQVPKHLRKRSNPNHPSTPDAHDLELSWRRFRGQVSVW